MFIVDSLTNELRDRVKKARPALVWGLLLGKRDGAERILQATHLANTSETPTASININYSLIAKHLQTLGNGECEVIGYYYSCTEKTPVPTIIESLPLPTTYYALRLVSTPTQSRWEVERIDRTTGNRVKERLRKGSLQEIDQLIEKLLQSKSNPSASEHAEKPRTFFQRLTTFVSRLYPRRPKPIESQQEQAVNDAHLSAPHEEQEVVQPPEQPRDSIVIVNPQVISKPIEQREKISRSIPVGAPQTDRVILAKYQIRYLYHMTHWSNLQSILQRGLLSHNNAHQYGYVSRDIADSDVVHRRAWKQDSIHHRSINDYAPLYFNPRNPMLYVRKAMQGEIVMLGFDPSLLFDSGVVFTDGNAAATNTKFYNQIADLEHLNWHCIHGSSWNDITDGRRIRCAEVLVHSNIPIEHLTAVFCRSSETFRTIKPLLMNYPHIRLCIDYSLYF